MNFYEAYRRKVVSVEEALQQIKSHHEVVCALVACEPATLLGNLHTISIGLRMFRWFRLYYWASMSFL